MSSHPDPIDRFRSLFERAERKEPGDHTKAALATADAEGRPSVRMVLLKDFGEEGFVFYTNFGSRKALELEENPRAALCFYWEALARQVRVAGPVERLPDEVADAYFASRSRGSQIGAWASKQSEPLPSRRRLVADYLKLRVRFAGRRVPRPDFWGGYRIRPERMEFWINKAHRLHDRVLYLRDDDGWSARRLYP